jgi:aminoglycoside phosphotransferase family enzyme/predicted kinase
MELSRLITLLSDPAAYPVVAPCVEVHQTHISAVFLAGPYAYKIKKPVNPGFLDFSTLDKRRHYCEEEVRLNRRLAPHVYLGVVPIVEVPGGVRLEEEGDPIEWAVKMQRLPEAATYQERLRQEEISVEHVERLAVKIAEFHKSAKSSEQIAAFGRFDAVSRLILDVYDLASTQVGTTVSREVFERLRELAELNLLGFKQLIESRSAQGKTRDCHGDLHLDHVYYFPERQPPGDLVIVDCIEFNERFRFIDPVADMAFAFMDLCFWGRRDLARAFAAAYFRARGDEEGRPLLPLYAAYRATVRGAVEGMLLTEKEVPEIEQSAAMVRSRAHWLLALAQLEEPVRRPCLVLVGGLPGAGKSVLARGLAQQAGFHLVRSDVVRKELAGLPTEKTVPPELRERIYGPAWDERTYSECLNRAQSLLFEGKRVVIDATFRQERQRQVFLRAAVSSGVSGVLLLCHAQPETVRKRILARHSDASDADWSVHESIAGRWEEPSQITLEALHRIATDDSSEQALSAALQVLEEFDLYGSRS